jgi:hypothetical protein
MKMEQQKAAKVVTFILFASFFKARNLAVLQLKVVPKLADLLVHVHLGVKQLLVGGVRKLQSKQNKRKS